jgi:ATP/maltotriose-dependent transcriptional regulator MalT
MPRPSPSLLESKFQPQLGPRAQVSRLRLAVPEALVQGSARAVSVVAPTGYGKTTLLAQWHAALDSARPVQVDVAWLNLDENDNDTPRLLRYLYAALGRRVPALAADAAQELSRTTNLSVLLEDLSSRLAAHQRPVVLFLDDLHLINDPEAARTLDWLLRYAGTNLRFVVGSREALGWPQAELRLRGQLVEIDQRALAFDDDEARRFCASRLAHALEPAALPRLLEKTEGWPAAMELLTLALNDAPDAGRLIADFATSERGVLEYLGDAVFGRLPPGLRALAHELGQFDRFCADLAAAALGGRAPDALLADLQRRHLFMIPLDRQGRWFRFHHLVREYLRKQDPRGAATIDASLIAGGQWLFDNGMVDDAIDCAARARQWDLACRWLLRAAEDSAQRLGDGANLLRWIPAIPRDVLDRYPLIRLSHVFSMSFSLAFRQNTAEFERVIGELEALADRLEGDPSADPAVVRELRCALPLQRLMWEGLHDNAAGLRERTEAWLAAWPDARARYRGDMLNVAAFACKTTGDIDAGLDYCARGQALQESDHSEFGVSWSMTIRALLHLKRGDFHAALRAAQEGLEHIRDRLQGHPEQFAYHQGVRAAVMYEFDDGAGASQALDTIPDALDDRGVADFVLLTHLTRARLQFRDGQPDTGLTLLQLGRKLGQRRGLPRVSVTLAGEECVWLCRLGRHDAALELARDQDFDRTLHPQYGMTADKAARVGPRLLMAEQPEMAIAQLGPPLVRATERGFHHRRVELLILHAAALLRAGRTAEAVRSWGLALEVGERFGYRRVFLDDLDIATSLNHAARGHEGFRPPAWLKPAPARAAAHGDEPLTRKELRILAFLESGASNREIADSLFVSEGTLKWHLHNIYRKLGCRNRSGAIAAARRQGLL